MKMGGPEMAPHTPQRSQRPGKAVPLLYSPAHCEGAPKWPPIPPSVRSGPAKPCRSTVKMGGPEMAPQTPQRSERPGEAVPLL